MPGTGIAAEVTDIRSSGFDCTYGRTMEKGKDDFDREGEWAVRLSQHLFSKLVDEMPELDSNIDYRDAMIKRICP